MSIQDPQSGEVKPPLVVQTTGKPTNKLITALTTNVVLTPFIQPAVQEAWPQIASMAFSGPAVTALVGAILTNIVALLLAYIVRDRAGFVVPGTT